MDPLVEVDGSLASDGRVDVGLLALALLLALLLSGRLCRLGLLRHDWLHGMSETNVTIIATVTSAGKRGIWTAQMWRYVQAGCKKDSRSLRKASRFYR